MISNDLILNLMSFTLLLFLFLWGGCFFIFVYKILGGPKVGVDSFLYFNFMFFRHGGLANLALTFLVLGYLSAAVVEYRRMGDNLMLLANLAGSVSFLFFSVYGKYFYRRVVDDKKPLFFIRVFLTELDFSLGAVFLWLSRLTYMIWVVMIISR
jgi:hypothetical protein